MAADDRDAEFAEFRAETRLQVSHLREMLQRLMPMHDARSGDLREVAGLKEDVAEIKAELGEVHQAVGKVSDSQKRMLAIVVGLQIAVAVFLWALDKGLVQFGGPP